MKSDVNSKEAIETFEGAYHNLRNMSNFANKEARRMGVTKNFLEIPLKFMEQFIANRLTGQMPTKTELENLVIIMDNSCEFYTYLEKTYGQYWEDYIEREGWY